MEYNVKFYKYKTGIHLRTYSKPVGKNNSKLVDDSLTLSYTDRSGPFPIEKTVVLPSETGRLPNYSKLYLDSSDGDLTSSQTPSSEHSVQVSRNRTISKVNCIARSNIWEWFCTFTFDGCKIDRYSYKECTEKMSNWLSNCRKICPNMKYLVVPEQHKDGAYHFHGLFADCKELDFVDSGIRRKKSIVYNIGKYKFGFSEATRLKSLEKTCNYVTKYITKELCLSTMGKKRYWRSRNLEEADAQKLLLTCDEKNLLLSRCKEFIKYKKHTEHFIGLSHHVLYDNLKNTFNVSLTTNTLAIDYYELEDFDILGVIP